MSAYYSVRNCQRKKIIATSAKNCLSLSDRLFGLLRKSNPRYLIFRTRFGIHTLFLKGAIDVIILDENQKVVKLKASLLPNRLFFWNPLYDTVLELPVGTIEKSKIRVGDRLRIDFN